MSHPLTDKPIATQYKHLRSLRLRLGVEKDEVTLIHINLALDQIDQIVRDLFNPDLAQDKKIFVLN